MPTRRRHMLLSSPSYVEIIAAMTHKMELEALCCQRAESGELAYRVVAKLSSTPATIDLFHNSATGYRAQYLLGEAIGEAANDYALTQLLPAIALLVLKRRPICPAAVLEQSLRHPWTKVWVHQGPWLRHARKDEWVLRVPDWQGQATSANARSGKLIRWGMLAPDTEAAFVIKGGFVFSDGRHRLGEPPKNRAQDIHSCGFT